ncbi:bifunctional DNA primase/polymerase [Streptomyces rugosispiralis]|uniref:Bifunctional DNA primase/polymerase n=1 Tax=Streptomyces rugosispiralis TaxID=2967341 RepID=A0ABT1V190_9ACTN|nr:bifunctional DNA primase/polymerase [Streptomyces rugosispiralis]MCQ8191148.1 bifunctional DNA primase/polymerase [Streptomyces rugosispiralis]
MSRSPQDSLHTAAFVTPAGADWLASASASPRGVQALWAASPTAPVTLPCGTAFDVISMDALFGRRVVGRLWTDGPGTGPVAAQGGRVLLFATPGTAQRLPALLGWEEWGAAAPPLLCYGRGDAVTVPPLFPPDPGPQEAPPLGPDAQGAQGAQEAQEADARKADARESRAAESRATESGIRESAPTPSPTPSPRWLVAPDVRGPWLPGPEVLLWACVRAARATCGDLVSTAVTSAPAAHPG